MNTAELVKEAKKAGIKEAKDDGIKKAIRMERAAGLQEKTILAGLLTEYGSDFSEAQLKQIMKETEE